MNAGPDRPGQRSCLHGQLALLPPERYELAYHAWPMRRTLVWLRAAGLQRDIERVRDETRREIAKLTGR